MKRVNLYLLLFFVSGYYLTTGCKVPGFSPRGSAETAEISDSATVKLGTATIISDLDVPWDLSWGPDNWIWFSERVGTISRVDPQTGKRRLLLKIPDLHKTNLGLLSMILHPRMNKSPYVFVNYPCLKGERVFSKVVRYTYKYDTLIKPKVLLEIPAHKGHMGSRFAIGEDGKLMLAVGDFVDPGNAQNEKTLNGKVLRINIDGSIPSDNPIKGGAVWARGFRVPQGLTFNSNGLLYTAEHGDANDDEVNLIRKGGNYGYPDVTGICDTKAEELYCQTQAIVEPLKAWTPTIAPAGMAYYRSLSIPQWNNSLLLVTLKESDLRVLKLNEAGDAVLSEKIYLDNEYGRLRDVCVSPGGDIYIATSNRDWKPKKEKVHPSDDRIIRISRFTNAAVQSEIKTSETVASTAGKTNGPGGQVLYNQYCASCHREDGSGQPGLFPSLCKSQKTAGNRDSLIAAVINGSSASVKITGQQMPAFHFLPDRELADILTYIRTNFGSKAEKISVEQVKAQRK